MKAADLFDLEGQVALVTGASSGLGGYFSKALAANGATVYCAARRLDALESLVDDIQAEGGKAHALRMDVADLESVTSGFDHIRANTGVPTIICNNAGVAESGPALHATDESWRRVIDINLDSVFRVAREGAKGMREANVSGSIINTASILGLRIKKGVAAYNASKAAVVSLTQSLAAEWARYGIRVNAIAPGYFPTEMNADHLASPAGQAMMSRIPLRRFGGAHDLDGALLLLASNASAFMTGVTIPVDGGHILEISE